MKTQTKKLKDAERNNYLENIIGNLLVAEQQVDKLKALLIEGLEYVPYQMNDDETPIIPKDSSTFPFIKNGKLYKIHLNVEKVKNESLV